MAIHWSIILILNLFLNFSFLYDKLYGLMAMLNRLNFLVKSTFEMFRFTITYASFRRISNLFLFSYIYFLSFYNVVISFIRLFHNWFICIVYE